MPSDRITITVDLKPYLKAFIISVYGPEPVFFKKKDKVNALISFLLNKTPPGYIPKKRDKDQSIEIILPFFEGVNINVYNHISERSNQIIERRFRDIFFVTFNSFMDECFRHGMTKIDAITTFIEKYDLPFTSGIDDMLRKEIYRSRKILQKWPKREYNLSKKSLPVKRSN